MPQRVPILTGEKVMLCAMTVEDQPFFRAWLAGSEELRRQIDDPRIPAAEDQERWFARSKEADRNFFSILALDGTLLGNAGLVDIDPKAGTAQFRITIGNLGHQGKGYGKDASRLVLRYAFSSLGLASVWLRVRRDNERAQRLYRSLGFVPSEGSDRPGILRMTLARNQFLPSPA